MKKNDTEMTFQIKIFDNTDWQPDLEFSVELYDSQDLDHPRIQGDDTITKITILDEDFPGTLGFAVTDINVHKNQDKVDITVVRTKGSDGKISVMIRTEQMNHKEGKPAPNSAIEFEHFLPVQEFIFFKHQENEQTISV